MRFMAFIDFIDIHMKWKTKDDEFKQQKNHSRILMAKHLTLMQDSESVMINYKW